MNRDDVLILARAGFTAEQIAALAAVNPAKPEPAEAPAAPAAAPAPAAPAAAAPAPDNVTAILEKLGVLTETIQANGINASRQPAPETADDILAAIIAPPKAVKE